MPVVVFVFDFLCFKYFHDVSSSLPVGSEGGKVFSMDLQLPAWWKIILSSFVGLMDSQNIGLTIEIAFLSSLQDEI